MLKQNKAYIIIVSIIWPFASVIYGIKYFENRFARKMLVLFGFGFLGFTALEEGDLERYASSYYEKSNLTIRQVTESLLTINTGKFYNEFLSVIFSFFNNHHYFFSILYIIFGYLLINTVFYFFVKPLKYCTIFEKLLLVAFALYFSIRSSINLAFYTGAIYYLYMTVRYLFDSKNNNKFLLLTILTPLFHIGLAPVLLASAMLFAFKKNTYLYIVPFFLSLMVSQTSVVSYIDSYVSKYDNEFTEKKYTSYVSEDGQERLELRYEVGKKTNNFKLIVLNKSRETLQLIVLPFGFLLVWLKRKTFFQNEKALILFNAVLATWTVSNLMMNISQGERFLQIHNFLCFGLLVFIYQIFNLKTYFLSYYKVLFLISMFYGVGSLYAALQLVGIQFFISNFVIETISSLIA